MNKDLTNSTVTCPTEYKIMKSTSMIFCLVYFIKIYIVRLHEDNTVQMTLKPSRKFRYSNSDLKIGF